MGVRERDEAIRQAHEKASQSNVSLVEALKEMGVI
jgi:hypothetical protein